MGGPSCCFTSGGRRWTEQTSELRPCARKDAGAAGTGWEEEMQFAVAPALAHFVLHLERSVNGVVLWKDRPEENR